MAPIEVKLFGKSKQGADHWVTRPASIHNEYTRASVPETTPGQGEFSDCRTALQPVTLGTGRNHRLWSGSGFGTSLRFRDLTTKFAFSHL